MGRLALITGASAGLGTEFARQLAARRIDLVLVARDAVRLAALAHALRNEFGVHVEVLAADLTDAESLERVAARVAAPTDPIDILINNAGFGVYAGFESSDITDERRLHELLSWVPLRLMHAAVPGMLARGEGWILNVASAAAFLPSGTYGSAKLAVTSLSRSLNARYCARGIRVTALCPGLVATEFHTRMGEDHLPRLPRVAWADASRVVSDGLRALSHGRPVLVSDWRYRLLRPLMSALPDRWLERVSTTNDPSR